MVVTLLFYCRITARFRRGGALARSPANAELGAGLDAQPVTNSRLNQCDLRRCQGANSADKPSYWNRNKTLGIKRAGFEKANWRRDLKTRTACTGGMRNQRNDRTIGVFGRDTENQAGTNLRGHFIRRFGVLNIMLAGALLNVLCVGVNLVGTEVGHFWTALVFLGVGWNFLYVGGTTLLTETYSEPEKAKAQGLNDFLVFTTITVASLSAGALQHYFGWQAVNVGVVPLIVLIAAAIIWLKAQRRSAPGAVREEVT